MIKQMFYRKIICSILSLEMQDAWSILKLLKATQLSSLGLGTHSGYRVTPQTPDLVKAVVWHLRAIVSLVKFHFFSPESTTSPF